MGVSKNSGFSPQIIHFNRVFHYKPSILKYPYFWKHLHLHLLQLPMPCTPNSSSGLNLVQLCCQERTLRMTAAAGSKSSGFEASLNIFEQKLPPQVRKKNHEKPKSPTNIPNPENTDVSHGFPTFSANHFGL